jgi:prephenate dehydrogenase
MPTQGDDNIIFDTIAIVGVGLIGGSIGMAARKNKLARRIIGVGRTEQKLMRAKILGAIDEYSLDIENGASEADLVIICTPVRLIGPTLQRMSASLKDGAVVTDVGSTKGEVVLQAESILPNTVHFVGGHPMAGSEQAGVEAAFSDLFMGAMYVFTPTDNTDLEALGKLTSLADAMGANVLIMNCDEHDNATAIISHLPHVMSAALLQIAEDAQHKSGKVFNLAAGSFRDLTRISDSPPEIWRDIALSNKSALLDAIGMLQKSMADFKRVLKECDEETITRFFEQAGKIRQTYLRISK